MQQMNEAVYVQINADTASEDSNTSNSNAIYIKTERELWTTCVIIVAAVLFVAGLGLYFLITKH